MCLLITTILRPPRRHNYISVSLASNVVAITAMISLPVVSRQILTETSKACRHCVELNLTKIIAEVKSCK